MITQETRWPLHACRQPAFSATAAVSAKSQLVVKSPPLASLPSASALGVLMQQSNPFSMSSKEYQLMDPLPADHLLTLAQQLHHTKASPLKVNALLSQAKEKTACPYTQNIIQHNQAVTWLRRDPAGLGQVLHHFFEPYRLLRGILYKGHPVFTPWSHSIVKQLQGLQYPWQYKKLRKAHGDVIIPAEELYHQTKKTIQYPHLNWINHRPLLPLEMVAEVPDGDEFITQSGKHIRLQVIDAPEKGQPGFNPAREALIRRVSGQLVEIDPKYKDPYGRTVAEVFVPDPFHPEKTDRTNVGLSLLESGFVRRDPRFDKGEKSLYKTVEEQAKAVKRGLWSVPGALDDAPWDFRQRGYKPLEVQESREKQSREWVNA